MLSYDHSYYATALYVKKVDPVFQIIGKTMPKLRSDAVRCTQEKLVANTTGNEAFDAIFVSNRASNLSAIVPKFAKHVVRK